MIINLRGCNGSGKTTAAWSLIDGTERCRIKTTNGMTTLVMSEKVALVGPYDEGKCGGCDRIKTFELMREAIREAASLRPVVVFEGVIVSTVFGSWAEFCREVPFVWAFLDTPLEVCLARIQARNGGQPIKEELVRSKWETVKRIEEKARAAGFQTEVLHYERAGGELRALCGLGEGAGRDPAPEVARGAGAVDGGSDSPQISLL